MGLTRLEGWDDQDDNEIPGLPTGTDPLMDREALKKHMIKIVGNAVEEVTALLMVQAIRAILEERKTGGPGPEFELFNDDLAYYLKLDPKNRLEMVLAGKLVFLLATSYAMLGVDTIDPSTQEFRDPGPLAGTDKDPRKTRKKHNPDAR